MGGYVSGCLCTRRETGISDVTPLSGISGLSRVSLIPLFCLSPLLFFCLALFLFLSYPFVLLAHSRDFFFSKPPFSKENLWAFRRWVFYLVVCAAYAAIYMALGLAIKCNLYSIFILRLFLSILFDLKKSGIVSIETPDRNSQWYQHLLTLFAIFFTRAIPKGLTLGFCLCFTFVKCACFVLYCIQLV